MPVTWRILLNSKTEENIWKNLDNEHSKLLNTLYTCRVMKAQYSLLSQQFEVDFELMTLKNCTDNEQHLLMKVEI